MPPGAPTVATAGRQISRENAVRRIPRPSSSVKTSRSWWCRTGNQVLAQRCDDHGTHSGWCPHCCQLGTAARHGNSHRSRRGSTTLLGVSSTASPHPDGGIDVVVDADGALHVPASELARHGVRAGSHLRIVTDPAHALARRSVRGAFAGTAAAHNIEDLLAALDDARSERIADVEQRWA
ncbi:MAG: hypothetical protein LC799_01720 [Actinobacteria bacterium]|nr:hypothetical protein [Actinomycetota bacterium]